MGTIRVIRVGKTDCGFAFLVPEGRSSLVRGVSPWNVIVSIPSKSLSGDRSYFRPFGALR